jgi:hypothetical protein
MPMLCIGLRLVKLDKCLDMTTAVIHAQLYTKPPTTQSLLDVAVVEYDTYLDCTGSCISWERLLQDR